MASLTNTIQNNALAALSQMAPGRVNNAIQQASAKTGVDFAYLLQQAKAESSFNPEAKAKTSSASGLYQFIESTWMGMIDKHGDKHGINTDGKTRGEILNLRNDPRAASLMAAEFASDNEQFLSAHVNSDVEIGSTELYFAHFLGAGQASAFLNAKADDGMQKAAYLFPKAAKANQNVFYNSSTGEAKSLNEVYAFFDKKFSLEGDLPASPAPPAETKSPTKPTPRIASNNIFNGNRPASLYQDLFTNALDVMFLTQMMDLPISSKNGEFNLFSSHSILK